MKSKQFSIHIVKRCAIKVIVKYLVTQVATSKVGATRVTATAVMVAMTTTSTDTEATVTITTVTTTTTTTTKAGETRVDTVTMEADTAVDTEVSLSFDYFPISLTS